MGPRPVGRGNRLRLKTGISWSLQWGHVLSDVETCGAQIPVQSAASASMGPRPVGRGNRMPRSKGDESDHASMGPRPVGRGNASGRQSVLCSCASMGPRPVGRGNGLNGDPSSMPDTLQWGHVLSAVETSSYRLQPPVRIHNASMGPRPLGRGTWRRADQRRLSFNGATSSRPWKHAGTDAHDRFITAASMGPRPLGRGNDVTGRPPTH